MFLLGTAFRQTFAAITLIGFLTAPLLIHDPAISEWKSRARIPEGENAATFYLKAIEALPAEDRDGYKEYLSHVPWDLALAGPVALSDAPTAVEQIRQCESAMDYLAKAAAAADCAFTVNWEEGPAAPMPGLSGSYDLLRGAICWGKLLEQEGKAVDAAVVYLNVIWMGTKLGRCPYMYAHLGRDYVQQGGGAIEGLLSRDENGEAAELILAVVGFLPQGTFDAARILDEDRVMTGVVLRISFLGDVMKGREGILREMDFFDPGDWPVPETRVEIALQLASALKMFDDQQKEIVATAKLPYAEAFFELQRLIEANRAHWRGEAGKRHFAAGILQNFVSDTPPVVLTGCTLAEARIRALALLAGAAVVKGRTGEYPVNLAGLKDIVDAEMTVDPCTGQPFAYWLTDDGLPAVECGLNSAQRETVRPELWHFGLSFRRGLEEQRLAVWRDR